MIDNDILLLKYYPQINFNCTTSYPLANKILLILLTVAVTEVRVVACVAVLVINLLLLVAHITEVVTVFFWFHFDNFTFD
mmetsp:Transcript_14350/g.26855  ORF Transcript_14350/g.26855 Transcript_14350/m.26855 type:complete len:80 (-) Transcript_14350:589-828(-)